MNAFTVPRLGCGGGLALFWSDAIDLTIQNYS